MPEMKSTKHLEESLKKLILDSKKNDAILMNHESCNIDLNNINHDVMNYESLRLKRKLLNQLLEWGVFYPEKIIEKQGVHLVREAVERTKFVKNVKAPGAYFRTVLKSIA